MKVKHLNQAREGGIEGVVIMQFVINKEGEIEDVKVLNGISLEIKRESLNLLKKMPKWTPGTHNEKPAKVRYTLPIQFRLQERRG